MTLHFPDVYSGQAGIPFTGAPVAIVKATQGAGYTNPDFTPAKARAASAGAYLCGYHFLEAGNGAAQAAHCHAVAGSVPLMLDMEEDGVSRPGVPDAAAFIDAYRKLGGTCFLLYLPHWYWQKLGSPSLAPLISRGMLLVSSNYTAYSDDGPGWAAYGGMTPAVWQYSSTATFNGWHPVDMNAFKGSVAEFRSLATTGKKAPVTPPSPPPAAPSYPVPAHLSQTVQPIGVHFGWEPGAPLSPHWRWQLARWTGGKPGEVVASDVVTSPHFAATVPGPGEYAWRVQAAGDSPFTPWREFTA
jgi:lysozyme